MGESVPDGGQRVIQSYGWCGLAAGGEQAGWADPGTAKVKGVVRTGPVRFREHRMESMRTTSGAIGARALLPTMQREAAKPR